MFCILYLNHWYHYLSEFNKRFIQQDKLNYERNRLDMCVLDHFNGWNPNDYYLKWWFQNFSQQSGCSVIKKKKECLRGHKYFEPSHKFPDLQQYPHMCYSDPKLTISRCFKTKLRQTKFRISCLIKLVFMCCFTQIICVIFISNSICVYAVWLRRLT